MREIFEDILEMWVILAGLMLGVFIVGLPLWLVIGGISWLLS